MNEYLFKTERLGIRNWRKDDLFEFAKMGKDKEVMKYFPSLLSEQQTLNLMERMQVQFEEKDYAYLAVEVLENQEFIAHSACYLLTCNCVTEHYALTPHRT